MSQDSRVEDAAKARDASTVMPLREAPGGFEVFMVRRHGKSGFMANRYVYPGGKLDEADCTERAAEHVEGMTPDEARERLAEDVPPLVALGLFLAGVRETFEESGLLLARRRGERDFIDLTSDEEVARRYLEARERLAAGELALSTLADREDLLIPLDRLGYFAHWITPYVEERRYDTRFFVVLAPDSQKPLHDEHETTDSVWIRPADALDRCADGDFQLAPPTMRTLEQLSDFDSARSALEFAQTHDPPTILPYMEMKGQDILLYLPGDPEFPHDEAGYGMVEAVDDGPTRMRALAPGHWENVSP